MKKQNDLDQFLRAALDPYKPAPDPSGKRKFLEEAAPVVQRRGFFRSWRFLAVAALLVSLTGSVAYYYTVDSTTEIYIDTASVDAVTPVNENRMNAAAEDRELQTDLSQPDPVTEKSKINILDGPTATFNNETPSQKPSPDSFAIASQGKNAESATPKQPATSPSPGIIEAGTNDISDTVAEPSEEMPPPLANTIDETTFSDSASIETNIPGDDEYHDPDRRHFEYSVFYRPDLLFNIIDNNKLVHALGAEIHYRFPNRRILLRTGLGVSFSKGYNEYVVNYNEYLGSYLRLDSITFEVAPDNFTLVSQLHQSEQTVYDTAVQALPSKVYQKYYYLQLPLMAGYDLVSRNDLSFGFRAGAIFSVLLNDKPAEMNYDAGEDLVIGIDDLTPERVNTNWQVTAGLNFTMRGPKRTFVEIEPAFSYYFKAMHQEAVETKNPYSIGIRVAIGFR